MNTAIFFGILLLFTALLWLIPGVRRRAGTWLTAGKTVPLGCLTTVLVPTLLYELFRLLGRWRVLPLSWLKSPALNLTLGALGLALGILVIAAGIRWLRRRYPHPARYPRWPFVVTFLMLGLAAVVLPVVMMLLAPDRYLSWWSTFPLPDEKDTAIAFEQRSIHPFLVEYNYRLRFQPDGHTSYRYLRTNTGGPTRFNVYRLRNGRLYFVDKDAGYIVDPARTEIYMLLYSGNRFYLAPFGTGPCDGYSWSPDGDRVLFRYGSQVPVAALPLTDELDGKGYYGSITDDFYTAAEQDEL